MLPQPGYLNVLKMIGVLNIKTSVSACSADGRKPVKDHRTPFPPCISHSAGYIAEFLHGYLFFSYQCGHFMLRISVDIDVIFPTKG